MSSHLFQDSTVEHELPQPYRIINRLELSYEFIFFRETGNHLQYLISVNKDFVMKIDSTEILEQVFFKESVVEF